MNPENSSIITKCGCDVKAPELPGYTMLVIGYFILEDGSCQKCDKKTPCIVSNNFSSLSHEEFVIQLAKSLSNYISKLDQLLLQIPSLHDVVKIIQEQMKDKIKHTPISDTPFINEFGNLLDNYCKILKSGDVVCFKLKTCESRLSLQTATCYFKQ